MYHPAFDTIHFATNGSDRLTISSAGVVGVTGNLTVAGTITSTGAITGNVTGNITGNVTGNLTGNVTGNVTGAVTGNATTATALQTGRTIAITTGATGTATSFDGSANISIPVTALNADYINAGTLAEARLPTSPSTWLRAATAAAQSIGAVGTYAFLKNLASQTQTQGDTLAGSSLRYSGANSTSGSTPSGTWTCLGRAVQDEATLWVRTS